MLGSPGAPAIKMGNEVSTLVPFPKNQLLAYSGGTCQATLKLNYLPGNLQRSGSLKSVLILINSFFLFHRVFLLDPPCFPPSSRQGKLSLFCPGKSLESVTCVRRPVLTSFLRNLGVYTGQWKWTLPLLQLSSPSSGPRAWKRCAQPLWPFKMLLGESSELGKGEEDLGYKCELMIQSWDVTQALLFPSKTFCSPGSVFWSA